MCVPLTNGHEAMVKHTYARQHAASKCTPAVHRPLMALMAPSSCVPPFLSQFSCLFGSSKGPEDHAEPRHVTVPQGAPKGMYLFGDVGTGKRYVLARP